MPYQQRRKLWARIWMAVALLLLLGGQYFFYRFSTDSLNSYKVCLGMTFGSALWSIVLLGAMWMRHDWARYVLIVLTCFAIVGFGGVAMMLKKDSIVPLATAMRAVVSGLALYAAALIPLGASHSLRNYLGPRTAGGH